MKYYVCSPIGRSGSKRIVFGLQDTLQANERMFISMEGVYDKNNPLFQGFKLYRERGSYDSDMYTNEQAIQAMNEWETPIVLHSHNASLLPTDPSGWKFILSSRKRKIDVVLSTIIAGRTKSYGPQEAIDDNFGPFEVRPLVIEKWLEEYIKRENTFIDNVKALTGKPPAVIYLEDSWQMIQQKTGRQFSPESEVQDTLTKSIIKAEDYITNYTAIQKRYDNNLNYYKNQFMTETN